MKNEYEYTSPDAPRRSFWQWLSGKPKPAAEPATNHVEPQARWMLEYLASKDRNGVLRVAYWACNEDGRGVEVVGDLEGKAVAQYNFPGPQHQGGHTYLAPAIRDYLEYLKKETSRGAKRGLAVFITDGKLHDQEEVEQLTEETSRRMASGRLPQVNFVLVGVGSGVDEEQLEKIAHAEHDGKHVWCHRVAEEIHNVAELVGALVDETMTVASGGTITDDSGKVLREYEGRLPAVLEFRVPRGAKSFTLEIAGQRFTQPLPDEEEHQAKDHH